MTFPVLFALLASAAELYQSGVELFRKGQLFEAVAPLQQAAKMEPRQARYWLALGVVHAAASHFPQADEPFANACRLDARLPDACYYYGRNLYGMNRFEPSIDALKKALAIDPKPWRVHTGIAQSHEALARAAEAATHFEQALRLYDSARQPAGGEPPHLPYGVFLLRQGRLAPARAALEKAAALRPQSAQVQFELGRVLYQAGELQPAVAHLSKAVELGHGSAAHLLLGRTYLRLGRAAEAQRHLQAGDAMSDAKAR